MVAKPLSNFQPPNFQEFLVLVLSILEIGWIDYDTKCQVNIKSLEQNSSILTTRL